jgi:hemolysin activation/secretion protein
LSCDFIHSVDYFKKLITSNLCPFPHLFPLTINNIKFVFKSIFKLNLRSARSTVLIVTLSSLNFPTLGFAATIATPPIAEGVNRSLAQATPNIPRPDFQRPATQPSEPPKPLLPPSQEILQTTPTPNLPSQPVAPGDLPSSIIINRFEVTGSTVFTPADLAQITSRFTNKPLDFAQLLQVSSEITQLYVRNGYINSGAYIPGNQSFDVKGGTLEIKVIEGRVEDIVVTGTERLDPNYIKNRIALGANQPLKIDRLIESLQLLQLNPLIKSISTELVSGQQPGTSIIQLKVIESPNWQAGINIANNRSPSVGELQGQISASNNNVSGLGDTIGVAYGRSEASNVFDVNYTLPLNPHNGTLRLQYSKSNSRVIEAPFDRLDINSSGQDFGLTYRQPIIQTPTQEFAMGVTLARRETNTGYLFSVIGERIGYPSPGADINGVTRVTAARLFQDYTIKDTQQVFALRSQLNLGVNALDASINSSSPDSKFLTWRGQAQYVRALAPNSLFLVKVESQLADRPLLALEQIGLGGQDTVRGYRQDLLLADNGIIASAEVRLPIFTMPESKQIFQVVPFLDFGYAWNQPNNPSPNPNPNVIASGGLGLRYQGGDSFSAKLDYGIPFIKSNSIQGAGQEKGLYFSLNYNLSF